MCLQVSEDWFTRAVSGFDLVSRSESGSSSGLGSGELFDWLWLMMTSADQKRSLSPSHKHTSHTQAPLQPPCPLSRPLAAAADVAADAADVAAAAGIVLLLA